MKTWLWPRKNGNEGLRLKAQQEIFLPACYSIETRFRHTATESEIFRTFDLNFAAFRTYKSGFLL